MPELSQSMPVLSNQRDPSPRLPAARKANNAFWLGTESLP